MRGASHDHESRIEALFQRHAADVLAYATRRGATKAEAEDVLAETFLIAWRRVEDVPPDALPWLLGVARNILANQARSKRRRAAFMTRLNIFAGLREAEYDPFDSSLLSDELREALTKLSDTDREALLLVAWEGLTHEEAAVVAGMTRKGFSRRVSRARLRLGGILGMSGHKETEQQQPDDGHHNG